MKILQVIPYFVPAWDYGGPVQVAHRISRELASRGHEITVYTTDALNASKRTERTEEVIDGVRVKRFRNLSNNLAYKHKLFLSHSMPCQVRSQISSFNVIHMHEYRSIQNIVVQHYAKRHAVPYVLQAHGSLPLIAAKQWLKRRYDDMWGRRLLRGAARVIALTVTEAEQYQSMGVPKERIEIVPNGVDLSEFETLPDKGVFRKKQGISPGEKLILYLGRIHQTKGIDLLIRAFAGLAGKHENVRLAIVGPDDGYLSELTTLARELLISDRVMFTGAMYGVERLEAYVDADVFVTPSFLGFPVTFLEALACGTPIVTTDIGASLDWLNERVGYVTGYDAGQMEAAIDRILRNPETTGKFREEANKLVRERFNWPKITEKLEQIYLEIKR